MIRKRVLRRIPFALLVLACGSNPPGTPAPYTSLVRTCAPWDGPAVALYLTDQDPGTGYPTPPFRAITIYRSVDQLAGRSFQVTRTTHDLGVGQLCQSDGDCRIAASAEVRFGTLRSDSTIAVSYRFEESPAGVVWAGEARPRLKPALGFCG